MHLLAIESPEAFMLIGFTIVAIVLGCLLMRWAVRSDTIVNNQNATIYFLMKLCEKHGVSEHEIAELKDHFKIK